MLPREIREGQEKTLSPFAARSSSSRGRLAPEEKCDVRTDFERDTGRILYSLDFRRLRHKTQVFFNPQNDHICTRMEHVLHVGYIANTIARSLDLNPELVQAIALGHDLGHAPFGHSGERRLNVLLKGVDPTLAFEHETHSLRVVDHLAIRSGTGGADGESDGENRGGMNLTFEVRDGIVSHCGEHYGENRLRPDRTKTEADLHLPRAKRGMPSTLEACVVRISDRIAYVGRDIEDAVRAGIMAAEDIPRGIASTLGRTNGEIIDTLVTDVIRHSLDRDEVALGDEVGEAMEALLKENLKRIYLSEKIKRYEKTADNIVEGLFAALLPVALDPERPVDPSARVLRGFETYLRERRGGAGAPPAQRVADYIAGMTDGFAEKCYEEIYWF
jgi:dGTPase